MIASWSLLQQVHPRSNEQQHCMAHKEILSFAGACTLERRVCSFYTSTPHFSTTMSMDYEERQRRGGLMYGRL